VSSILITGGAGFVGRAFNRHFAAEGGRHVVVNVDLKNGRDCRDYFRTITHRFDLVIHLAALVGGRLTIEGDPLAVAGDLAIDADLFNWAVRTGQPRVVYYSSSAAYPTCLQMDPGNRYRLRESDIRLDQPHATFGMPDMSYGWTKLTGELLADYARAEGVNVHVLRPFSGYGADQDLDYPFPTFIARARQRLAPFPVWGTGEQRRDFIHISDVVAATLAVIEADCQQPVNLCTGRDTDFIELARLAMLAAGYAAEIEPQLDRPVGVLNRVGDPRLMSEFYTPRISLEEGIAQALR
jgi:nucleoside-diphosphate-sugar epimerase